MALKMSEGAKPVKSEAKGVDYGSHLGSAVAKPISGLVTTTKAVKGEEMPGGISQSETVHPGVFTNGMAITVEGGRTLNLGNYESARVGVSITVPCDKDSLNESYEFATEWVSGKINEAVAVAKGE